MTSTDAATVYGAQPTVLLIAEPGSHALAGRDALAMAGARMIGPVGFAQAAAALADAPLIDGVLMEAGAGTALGEGITPLDDALDAGAAWLTRHDAPIVITLDDSQIDDVTARFLGGRVQLLCAPTLAERVSALVIALAFPHAGALGSRVRQGNGDHDRDTERLNQLNAEVARIAETLARLAKADPASARPAMLGERSMAYRGPDGGAQGAGSTPVTATEIRQAIRGRRLRDQFFGHGLFEDPAWDMLLDLSAADLERARVSVSSLCIAAAVAPTTALRWISRMTEAGLFEREPDPFDRRRAFMRLSPKARDGMHEYWRAAKRAGTMIA